MTVIGFLQVPKLSLSTSSRPLDLDKLLLSATIMGVYVFAIFGMIVGGISYDKPQHLATFCLHLLLLIQVSVGVGCGGVLGRRLGVCVCV